MKVKYHDITSMWNLKIWYKWTSLQDSNRLREVENKFMVTKVERECGRDKSCQFSLQSCPTLCDPMDCSTPGFPVHHQLSEFTQIHVHWVVVPCNHLILCYPLLLPPSIFPSIRVFSSESVLHIRWPKYWSFSFSISPSTEYSGLISFRIDWLDLLAVQGTLKSLLNTTVQKR